jgi:hypothetical protein
VELECSHEQFLVVASRGLESPDDKKYYEQIIACDNFLYFKNMMVRRNLQIEQQAYNMMVEQDSDFSVDPGWNETQKVREKNEVECAIAMSMALEEEKKRLALLEDDELRRAIEMSKRKDKEEMSLFDPSTLLGYMAGPGKNKPVAKPMSVVNNTGFDLQPKESVNIINSTNVWKTSLNKDANVDFTLQGAEQKAKPEYVDKLIEKTEKITFTEPKKPEVINTPTSVVSTTNETVTVDESNFDPLNKELKKGFVINHDMPDYSNVKSRIDNTNKVNKEILDEEDIANEELKKKYQQIQKDKQDKLKAYRDMINKMKHEKREDQNKKVRKCLIF